jgi:hypothetical protein
MNDAPKHYQIAQQLRLLVQRVKAQSADYSELNLLVSPPHVPGHPYAIDVSQGRFSRRVWVDPQKAQNLQSGLVEAHLTRELRSTMMMVTRLAQRRG